ncbi:phage integrase N-terminal SAM-like domain-containing protein [Roseibium album]|uniref:phage integrase N-terminal SAM-like domain-containing protein n=1 Tax=Roseibium album TaxID=311410 RepID=UPI00249066A2|nr:phage integrase N-terminal SAM-like domain-containing protein [Roseibium album]
MTTFQTDAPITPLRQRMQQDMVMRGLGSHTQQDYVRHVRNFAAFLGRPPDTATTEDIRHYQLRQHETGVDPATINSTVAALRFFVHGDAQPAGSIADSGDIPQSARTTRGSERRGSRTPA